MHCKASALLKIIVVGKLVVFTAFLVFTDITLRYLIEEFNIIQVRPRTIPFYLDSHALNILTSFPYIFVMAGWSYFIVAVMFYVFRKQTNKPWYVNSLIASALLLSFYFFYWLYDRGGLDNGVDKLTEGIVLYVLLGLVLEVIFNLFFTTQGNAPSAKKVADSKF